MKKTALTMLCSAALAAVLAVSSNAASFNKTLEYKDGQFTDVKAEAWYAGEVKSAYELGLMNGKSTTNFVPDGTMTVAEGITMAARVNAIYNGKTAPANSTTGKWYDNAVKYAIENKIFEDGYFNSYDRNIRRYEMAQLFANALPKDYFPAKNNVKAIPDVNEAEEYADTLLMLYNAGIVMGSDEYGNFHPTSSIKRSEAAAIINRTALPENRLAKTLTPAPEVNEAYYLIDNVTSLTHTTRGEMNLGSSWNYENRFDQSANKTGHTTNSLSDTSEEGYVAINRNIDMPKSGTVTLDTSFTVSQTSGIRIYFADEEGNSLVEVYTKDGKYFTKAVKDADTGVKSNTGTQFIRVAMDLDAKTAVLSVNGDKAAEFALANTEKISRIYFSTTKEAKVNFAPTTVQLYANYPVNETFAQANATDLTVPYDWKTDAKLEIVINSRRDSHSLALNNGNKAEKTFAPVSGKAVFETYVLTNGATVTAKLSSGDSAAAEFKFAGGKFTSGDIAKDYFKGQWQILHVEVDTAKKTAGVYINGKYIKNVPFNAESFDKVSFNAEGGKVLVDDVKIYNIYDYADYVEKPVAAPSDDYILIMSVCSLWREGTHSGWDYVSPYDECSPAWGYYDEGIPETADWEIKYMAEHGIDAMEYCWYAESGTSYNTPQRTPGLVWALHDGYFYAKYSDMVDFYILWENANFNKAKMTLEQFKSYLWEYWVQMYFTDSRYLVINNKPVLNIYQFTNFVNTFGSEAEAKKVVEFMRNDIKNYGFDDIILLFADSAQNADSVKKIANMGADGVVAYAHDKPSFDPSFQENAAQAGLKNTKPYANLAYIPTVATGRNIMGWENTRTPLSTVPQHAEVMEIYKKALKNQNKGTEWQDKTIYFSTWNEFGEGHWLAPSGLNGFGYADVWRSAFTKAPAAHDDVTPTINQENRISHLYNDNRTPIRPWLLEESERQADVVVNKWEFKTKDDFKGWSNHNIKKYEVKNNALHIESISTDPMFRTPDNLRFEADKIDTVHIRMKSDVASTLYVYFITELDSAYNADKGVNVMAVKSDDFVDYYLKVSENAGWKGTIKQVRIDPLSNPGNVEIQLIEFLGLGEAGKDALAVDGIVLDIPTAYHETVDGELYVVADTTTGIFSMNNFYHEWNRFNGTLLIKTGTDVTFKFTVGSDKVLVNGTEKKLKKAFYTYDHIPVLPMNFIYDNAGIKYTVVDGMLKAEVRGIDFSEIESERKVGEYEFNIPGDVENWTGNNVVMTVSDGILSLTAKPQNSTWTGYDPGIWMDGFTIPAENVEKIQVRMRRETLPNAVDEVDEGMTLYFKTNKNSTLGEKQALRTTFNDGVDDGDGFKIYTFDPSTLDLWKDVITFLRFDPSNNNGIYEIDYFRIIPKAGMNLESTQEQLEENQNKTPEYKDPIPKDAKPVYAIEFDKATDRQLVSFGNANGTVDEKAGTLLMTANTGKIDIQMTLKSVPEVINDASKFDTMALRVKLPEGYTDYTATFFFMVGDMKGYDGKYNCDVSWKTLGKDADGYSLIVFDVSKNTKWTGPVTGIRFDPADLEHDITIDYIRFYKLDNSVPAVVTKPTKPAEPASADIYTELPVQTFDDNNAIGFISRNENQTLTVEKDPENSSNSVAKITATAQEKFWAYLWFDKFQFTPGATYKFSAKVRPISDAAGNKHEKYTVGLCFRFSGTDKGIINTEVSGDTWTLVEQEYTIPADYVYAAGDDRIGVFFNPNDDMAITFMVDDVQIEFVK